MEKEELERQFREASHYYYNLGSPIMLDSEFDVLRDKLEEEYPESEVLKEVGVASNSNWPKASHRMMMGSQNKCKTEEELQDWIRLNNIKFPLLVEHKLDGISMELIYENGKLVQGITRGDGKTGDDVTPNIVKIPNIPHNLNKPINVAIRGEVCLSNFKFKSLFANEFKNPRNLTAGFVKKKESENVKHLTFIAYDIHPEDESLLPSSVGIMHFLKKNGFVTPASKMVDTIADFLSFAELQKDRRSSFDISIDGLVLKQNEVDVKDRKEARPKKQIAWKFPPEEAITTLIDVEWSLNGETLTPVAVLDPVMLDGSEVSGPNLVNMAEINRLGLQYGSKVVVSKRNDVIPKVERVVYSDPLKNRILPPEHCPSCGGDLREDRSSRIYCPNGKCPAKLEQRLNKWVEKTGCLGIGKEMTKRWVKDGVVTKLSDIYNSNFLNKAIDSTNLKKATEKGIRDLYKIKTLPLEKFIAGFNIRSFGERHSKKLIAHGYDTLTRLIHISKQDFIKIEGLGEKLYNTFHNQAMELYPDMVRVEKYITLTVPKVGASLKGKTFVITGKLNMFSRKELSEKIEAAGGKFSGSVNKNTSYLVNNDVGSTSGKNKKALELNIPIICEQECIDMF